MSADGELMLTILASYAQEESLSVSENCKWYLRLRMKDGHLVGIRDMFGYNIERGVVTINENEAAIVRMVFREYNSGASPAALKMNAKKMELGEITKRIDPIVDMRQNDWFLVTAEASGVANTLTAAWGGFGNVCEKKVATVYIRPQRHTKKFMDASGRFTMTFFDFKKYSKTLGYLGSHSGADEPDKIENAGLTLSHVNGQPTFEEGKIVLLCKTIFRQQLAPENFTDSKIAEDCFPDGDYSVMYIAEIEEVYEID